MRYPSHFFPLAYELHPVFNGYRFFVFSVKYALKPKKQLSIESVVYEVWPEAEETVEHGVYLTAYHNKIAALGWS
jgi:hypothetical protein